LSPSCIANAFRQTMVLQHALFIQLFKNDYPIGIHQLPRQLVGKVLAPVGNPLVNMSHPFSPFGSFGCPIFCLRQAPLYFCQGLLVFAEETRIANFLSIRPTSTPTTLSHIDSRCSGTSQAKQAYQLPTRSRRTVSVFICPSMGR
jgi:hypothetical protein